MASWLKHTKIVDREFLYSWILDEVIKFYKPGANLRKFGDRQRIVQLTKYLKLLPTGDLMVTLCDATESVYGVITEECISNYERLNKKRITEYSKDCLILIKNLELSWVSRNNIMEYSFGEINDPETFMFAIIKIGEFEIFDIKQIPISKRIPMIYNCVKYKNTVKPIQF